MRYCDQCGTQLNDNAKFCSICGTPVAPTIEVPKVPLCKNCGEPIIEEGASFCANCGERYSAPRTGMDSAPALTRRENMVSSEVSENSHSVAEYLGRVVSLEKSVYTQTQTINEIQDQIDGLGHPYNYQKPEPPQHASLSEEAGDITGNLQLFGFGALIGGVIGLFAGSIVGGAIIGGSILLGGIYLIQAVSNANYNSDVDEEYQRNLNSYNAATAADKKRVKKELAEKARLSEILDMMVKKKNETVSVLELYYGKDIIFPKYRNLVAVCSFYEYFMSGRCYALTGHEGAYNIFENEVRLERICTKLDEVVQRLEDIKANQYMLYDVIQEGNRITERLVEESVRQSRIAERTAENTALAAHYAEIAANNAEACAWIGIANYLTIQEGKR